jgi:hypothetical protein
MMKEGNLKPGKQYIFYRAYCLVVVVIWNISIFWEICQGGSMSAPYVFLLLLFGVPAIVMTSSVFAFPWEYSIFGRYQRTMPPEESPILTKRFVGTQIRWLQTPFTISLYSSGIGLSIFGIGKAFIPLEYVTDIRKSIFWRCTLHHCWPEVRSPLKFSSKEIYLELTQ